MKVCIIGFDALEYTIVHRSKYPSLKQKEYGKVRMNVYPLSTPAIWASFITGEKPEKHGIVVKSGLGRQLTERVKSVSIKFGLQRMVRHWGAKVFEVLGLAQKRVYLKENFKVPTIFDFVGKRVAISIPAYNEWPNYLESKKLIFDALGDPAKERKLAEKAWKDFYLKKRRTLELMEEDWDLFMVHFYIADIIQHIWYYKENRIADLYRKLDESARQIATKLPQDTLLLIVSDHGLLNGYHTPYAFYSSNENLNLNEPKITDFADIIRQNLGVPSKRDIEKIKERLRRLGYI